MNDLIELKLITSEDENMTLVDYVKSCIKVRRFKEEDANINVNIKMYIFDHLRMYKFAHSSSCIMHM